MFPRALFTLDGAKRALAVSAAFSLLEALFTVAQSVCLARAIVYVWQAYKESAALDAPLLTGLLAGFAAALILRQVTLNAHEKSTQKFANICTANLTTRVAQSLYTLGPAHTKAQGSSAFVAQIVEGTDQVVDYISQSVLKWPRAIVLPATILVAVFAFDWVSGIIVLVCWPFAIIFMQLIGQSAGAKARARYAEFSRMSNSFVDITRGLATLKSFGIEGRFARVVFDMSERFRRLTLETLKVAMLSSAVLDIFATLSLAGVAIMLGFRLVEGTILFLPALTVLMLVPEFFAPLKALGENYHATLEGQTALNDFLDLIDQAHTPASKNAQNAECVTSDTFGTLEPKLFAQGVNSIEFDQVVHCFSEGIGSLGPVSFSASAGQIVGVFGKSGAGKSTLLNLVAGFIEPQGCQILVNGKCVPAPALGADAWRAHVAYIPQSPTIFNASLRENVAFYNPGATDEQVTRALDAVGLAPLLGQLPQGLDTQLGPGARAISGGQVQRLALSRALCDPARTVWLLDEPTAHVDFAEEERLVNLISSLSPGKIIFVASHSKTWHACVNAHIYISDGGDATFNESPAAQDCLSVQPHAGTHASQSHTPRRAKGQVSAQC
jgi:ATP-binding cassette subfamily C protein CydD